MIKKIISINGVKTTAKCSNAIAPNLKRVLEQIKQAFGDKTPSCFVSYAWSEDGKSNDEDIVEQMASYLETAGVTVHFDKKDNILVGSHITSFIELIQRSDFIIVFGSRLLLEKNGREGHVVRQELSQISVSQREQKVSDPRILPVSIGKNKITDIFPNFLADTVPEFLDKGAIDKSVFNILKRIYRIPVTEPKFISLIKDFYIRGELQENPISILKRLEINQHNSHEMTFLVKNINASLTTELFTLKPRTLIQIAIFLLTYYKESSEQLENSELYKGIKRLVMSVLARLTGKYVDQTKIDELRTLSIALERSRSVETHHLSHYCKEGVKWICRDATSSSWAPSFLSSSLNNALALLPVSTSKEYWYLTTSLWIKTLDKLTFMNWKDEFVMENRDTNHSWVFPYTALDVIETWSSDAGIDSRNEVASFFQGISDNMDCPEGMNFRLVKSRKFDYDLRLFYKFFDAFLSILPPQNRESYIPTLNSILQLTKDEYRKYSTDDIICSVLQPLIDRYQIAMRVK